MRRTIVNITLTENQQKYVRANYRRQTEDEMGRNLGISQSKVHSNMNLMGLQRPPKGRPAIPEHGQRPGFFNVDAYALTATI